MRTELKHSERLTMELSGGGELDAICLWEHSSTTVFVRLSSIDVLPPGSCLLPSLPN